MRSKQTLIVVALILLVSVAANIYLAIHYDHQNTVTPAANVTTGPSEVVDSVPEITDPEDLESENERLQERLDKNRGHVRELQELLRYARTGYPTIKLKEHHSEQQIVEIEEFMFDGEKGRVLHVCAGVAYTSQYGEPFCVFGGNYVLDWQGKLTIMGEYGDYQSGSDLHYVERLGAVGFTEASGVATTSTKSETTLVIGIDPLDCAFSDGMCINKQSIGFTVTFPSLAVSEIRTEPEWYARLEDMTWNEPGTKAFIPLACPAGCPEEVLAGFDRRTGEFTYLLREDELAEAFESEDSFSLRFDEGVYAWINDNEITVGEEHTITFE